MKQTLLYLAAFFLTFATYAQTRPQLNNARTFTVLAGTQINNNGNTVVDGNIGVAPGTTVTGFPPGVVNGTTEINNSVSQSAQTNVTAAYNTAASQTPTTILTGQNLGTKTLTPGVYKFAGNADLTGALAFDANGDINAIFIIQIDNDFTVAPNAIMNLRNGARELNIFWQVAGSATIGSSSSVKGTLMVNQNITVNSAATVNGRLFSRNGFVQLNQNALTNPESFITDISIAKSVSPGPYYNGSTVSFTIIVSNLGPRAASNVIVSDLLPSTVQYQSSTTTTNTTYNPTSGLWTIDSIANGGVDTLVINAIIRTTGFITNTATIAFFGDNNINNNTSAITPFCATPEQPGPINGPVSLCLGSTGHTYTIGPVPGADYYNWIVPTGWTITSGQGTTAITVNAGTDTLSANIFVTAGSNSCNDESVPSSLVVYATNIPPAPPANITGPSDLCASQIGLVYSVPAVRGASSYTWSVPSGWTITSGQGTNSITVNAGPNSGNISVTATNGCGTSTGTIRALSPAPSVPPTPGTITGNTIPCSGNAATTYTINNVTGATSYNWTVPAGWTITSGQGTTSVTVTPGNTSGNITVTASNACGKSSVSSIPVSPTNAAPGTPASISGNASICATQTGLIYTIPAVTGASSYTWTVPSGWTIISGQGTTSITVNAGSTSGNITVTASNGCGGSLASTLPITITNIPAIPAAINGTIVPCVGNNSTTYNIAAVPGATSYTWSVPTGWNILSGQGTTSITVRPGTASGVISVSAGNTCGSSTPRNLTVTPATTAPGTPGPISGNTIPCASGTNFTYSISAVTNAASYFWTVPSGWTITAGQGTTSITVTAGTGNGSITVSAVNGCGTGSSTTMPVTATTTRPAAPGPIAGTSNVCVGLTGLTYSISSVANASSYVWTVPAGWAITAGQGTTSITVAAGTGGGNITVSASNGCGLSAATVLTITPITSAPATPGTISGTNRPCVGNASVTYSTPAATGASTYTWTVPSGWTITAGQGTTTITVTPGTNSGNVTVTAVNSCGNSPSSTIAVTPATTPPATPVSISGNTMACANTPGNIYTVPSNVNATSYTWTVPAGWTITAGQGTASITTTTGTSGGNITVIATNDCGNSSTASLAVTPVISSPVTPGNISGNALACAGSTGNTYTIAAVATATSYIWTVPAGWTITGGQGTTSVTVTSGTTGGNITVSAINACGQGGASVLAVTPITTVPASPGTIAGSTRPCTGSTSLTYTVSTVSGATSYNWIVPSGWTITNGQGSTSISVTPGSSGGNITVAAINGCGSSPISSINVMPTSTPPATPVSISGNTMACANSSGNVYTVPNNTNASSYTWTVPSGWTITSGQGTASITTTAGSTGGNITVVAQNDCGNSSAATLAVTPVITSPVTPGNITGNTLACAGSTGNTYSIAAVATATSYVWTVPAGWTITGGQGTTNITVTSGTSGGNITVSAINSCGQGGASVLAVTPATTAPATPAPVAGSTVPCVGSTSLTYTVTAVTGATSYNWTVPTGWTIVSGQGTTSITVNPGTSAGSVSVSAINSCGSSPASSVTANPATTPPPAPVSIAGNTMACANTGGNTYSVPTTTNASSYTWTVPAGWTITSGQGTASIVASVGAAGGTISVIAHNDCGDSPAATLNVTPVLSAPVAPGPVTGNTMACAGSTGNTFSIAAVATATSYNWTVPTGWAITSGQGTTTITVTAGTTTGTITVAAVNSCGASPVSSLTVSAPTAVPPAPGAINGNVLVCGNQTALTYSVALVANASSYVWTVPTGWTITTGQGTTSITVTSGNNSGTISVAAANGCGSGTAQTQAITINPVPTTPVAITGDSIPCAGSTSVTYSIANVANASSYNWTVPTGWTIVAGQGSNSINVSVGAGAGNVSVTAINACGTSSAASLSVNPATTVPLSTGTINGNSALCSGQVGLTYSILPVANASNYTWTVPTGWVIISGQGTTSISVAAGTGAGTISVVASNGCGNGPASTKAVTLTTSAPGTPAIITGPVNPCAGTTSMVYTIAAVPGAVTYNWTVPANWTITSGQGTTSITVTIGSPSGTVSVTAANDCGESNAKTITVISSVTAPAAPTIISGVTSPCAGNTNRIYSVVPVSGAVSYDWTVPAGWTITAGQGTESISVTAGTTQGTISVTAQNGCGTSTATTLSVTPVTSTPLQPGSITGTTSVCAGQQNIQYTTTPVDSADTYTWTVPGGWTIISGQGTTAIMVAAGTTGGQVSVTADNDCGSSTASTQVVVISSPLVTPGPITDTSGPCNGLSYSIPAISGATTYEWTVPAGWTIISGQGTTTIQVKANSASIGQVAVTASNGVCFSNTVTLDADPTKGNTDINLPTAFSPNGDNINDTWEIANLGNYPENEITVINRWGNEVFRTKSYRNDWNGGSLSAGTYFYVMKVKMCGGEEKSFKGFVMIVK